MLKYEIFTNRKRLQELENNIWDDDSVPAVLKIGGNQYQIGLSYRGNIIRKKKKKSYRIIFQKPFLVDGAHEIHLNAEYDDPSLCRNKLSLDFFNRIGILSPHSKHVQLYINNFYKGIYLELESFDQYLLQKRKIPKGPIIYATNYHANFSLFTPENELKARLDEGYTVKYGAQKDLSKLENLVMMINTLNNVDFENEIIHSLDIDQYLTWLSGVVCTQNFDGFIHNYALYQNGVTNLFEITPWDYDGTWGRDLHGRPLSHDFVPIEGYNTLTGRLLHCSQFKAKYKEILSFVLENHFTPLNLESEIKSLFQTLIPFVEKDPYLHLDEAKFVKEKDYILNFIQKRNSYLKENLDSIL